MKQNLKLNFCKLYSQHLKHLEENLNSFQAADFACTARQLEIESQRWSLQPKLEIWHLCIQSNNIKQMQAAQ